ncbi:hypothetical protein AVJ23_17320 [Pseudoponticoccus marisrubri]|uniref:Uncharacterized protein n=1 Tax=Pseudoponticoccus marisrubri TaxID=1685382 RepID=A0A0W7WFV6_9RHOB|nr:hypothetical protein AVJ23_17320 [Pseudoponticoccus marisrubri]
MGLAPLRLGLLTVPAPKIAGQIYDSLKVFVLIGVFTSKLANKLNIIEEGSALMIGCIHYLSEVISPACIDVFVSNLFDK